MGNPQRTWVQQLGAPWLGGEAFRRAWEACLQAEETQCIGQCPVSKAETPTDVSIRWGWNEGTSLRGIESNLEFPVWHERILEVTTPVFTKQLNQLKISNSP